MLPTVGADGVRNEHQSAKLCRFNVSVVRGGEGKSGAVQDSGAILDVVGVAAERPRSEWGGCSRRRDAMRTA